MPNQTKQVIILGIVAGISLYSTTFIGLIMFMVSILYLLYIYIKYEDNTIIIEEWFNMELETIDQILANLKKDPNAYNHGMTEQMWMQECNRND